MAAPIFALHHTANSLWAVKEREKEVKIGVWILGSRVGIAYRPQNWGSAIADMHMVVPICGFHLDSGGGRRLGWQCWTGRQAIGGAFAGHASVGASVGIGMLGYSALNCSKHERNSPAYLQHRHSSQYHSIFEEAH